MENKKIFNENVKIYIIKPILFKMILKPQSDILTS